MAEQETQKTFVIEQSYFLEAPPHAVFQALTDPRELARWYAVKAEVDQKEGGTFSFEYATGPSWTGKVQRLEKDRVVSFSTPMGASVEFEIAGQGEGTLLRLRHLGIRRTEALEWFSSTWAYYLTNLKSVLGRGTDLRSKYDWMNQERQTRMRAGSPATGNP